MKFARFIRKRFQRHVPARPRNRAAVSQRRKKANPGTILLTPPLAQPTEAAIVLRRHFFDQNGPIRRSIEAFLADQRSEHTRTSYGKDLKRFLKFMVTRDPDQKIDRALVVAYKESLQLEKLAETTIDRHLATLRSFFDWLVEDGILPSNPATKVRFLSPKRLSRTRGFSDDEVVQVLAKPDLHRRTGALHYAILMVLFYCGLRRSEVCELRMDDLTSERGKFILRLIGKGNRERIIPLLPAVKSAIDYYFFISGRSAAETKDQPLFQPIRNHRTGVLKKNLDTSHIFYIVKRYARLAGIKGRVSPHSCRATAISNARDHQVPDRAIQEFAGWTSPDMITRYDKRKTAIEQSAALAISYAAKSANSAAQGVSTGTEIGAPPSADRDGPSPGVQTPMPTTEV